MDSSPRTTLAVTQADIERALMRLEQIDLDMANLLRNHIEGLRGRLRAYQEENFIIERRLRAYQMGDDRANEVNGDDIYLGEQGESEYTEFRFGKKGKR